MDGLHSRSSKAYGGAQAFAEADPYPAGEVHRGVSAMPSHAASSLVDSVLMARGAAKQPKAPASGPEGGAASVEWLLSGSNAGLLPRETFGLVKQQQPVNQKHQLGFEVVGPKQQEVPQDTQRQFSSLPPPPPLNDFSFISVTSLRVMGPVEDLLVILGKGLDEMVNSGSSWNIEYACDKVNWMVTGTFFQDWSACVEARLTFWDDGELMSGTDGTAVVGANGGVQRAYVIDAGRLYGDAILFSRVWKEIVAIFQNAQRVLPGKDQHHQQGLEAATTTSNHSQCAETWVTSEFPSFDMDNLEEEMANELERDGDDDVQPMEVDSQGPLLSLGVYAKSQNAADIEEAAGTAARMADSPALRPRLLTPEGASTLVGLVEDRRSYARPEILLPFVYALAVCAMDDARVFIESRAVEVLAVLLKQIADDAEKGPEPATWAREGHCEAPRRRPEVSLRGVKVAAGEWHGVSSMGVPCASPLLLRQTVQALFALVSSGLVSAAGLGSIQAALELGGKGLLVACDRDCTRLNDTVRTSLAAVQAQQQQ
uniref:Uncharacterized protein n=1 Tax=Chromera velia CCMP2878 TaxID=1169474 RepID=A0A0G4F4A2_9ALVE|eukprot:Cvel_14974.t1-p1 / transcript=Cvel_14974.t1 / gene=Cvel_14974 / organism=Chromera_velia_CCMP2878 / gene_product=hypothetical protein / transcript_product=hypothetical protein / location=Cvel_scaffold1088:21954-25108(-) / protein_length=540 / sequence_SO=supercontig / SO=protein_coding / is_pseudo=false